MTDYPAASTDADRSSSAAHRAGQPSTGGTADILVVEDEQDLADALCRALRWEGFAARSALDGTSALQAFADRRPDLVILDLALPDLGGLQVLAEIRDIDPGVGVLVLTARDALEDRVAGLTGGADDYLTKPFALAELLARLRSLLRRTSLHEPGAAVRADLVVGDLVMDEQAREVRRGGAPIALTWTEFELLRFLMRNPRQALSKAQILERVWHYDFGGDAHVVELYISYLRRKLDHDRAPMIHTVRGFGYVLKAAQ